MISELLCDVKQYVRECQSGVVGIALGGASRAREGTDEGNVSGENVMV